MVSILLSYETLQGKKKACNADLQVLVFVWGSVLADVLYLAVEDTTEVI